MVIATVKTRPVLKVAWQGLSDNWGTQWVKSWGHAEKVMFSSHNQKKDLRFEEKNSVKTALLGGLVHSKPL